MSAHRPGRSAVALYKASRISSVSDRDFPLLIAGYSTAHIGKSHLAFNRTMSELGFDYTFGDSPEVGAVKDFFAPYEGLPGNVEAPGGEYLTDRLTQETIDFIKVNRNKPFYAQLCHYAPHMPIQAPEEIVGCTTSFFH